MAIKSALNTWVIIAKNNIQTQMLRPNASVLFTIGKLFNFIFSVLIITAIFHQTTYLKGYTYHQAIIIALIFNFLDTVTQFFFRSLYTFRPLIVSGDFDLDLLKPLPSFFRPIFSGPDFLDIPPLLIKFAALVYFLVIYQVSVNIFSIFIFINGFVVAFSVHLLIASFCILFLEADNLVAIYRTLGQAAVVPTDLYSGVYRFILDFVFPVTFIFTVPAQALLGILSPTGYLVSFAVALVGLTLSLWFWRFSLRHYTSASS